MALTVRPLEDRDLDGYFQVRDMTYGNGISTPEDKRVFKTTQPFVAEQDGKIMGIFNVLDLSCTRDTRANLKCAGIASVAVLPQYRHLGVGSEMMRWSVPYLKSQGYQVASLYGFRETFYRKFGYEAVGTRFKMSCPTSRLPRIKPELEVGTVDWEDHAKLQACHEAHVSKFSGMTIRDDMHWGRILDEKKTIYTVGNPVEAYAILEHKIDFWIPQWVNEIGWSTQAGYRSIIAVLSQICINKTSLDWWEAAPSPFLAQFTDQGVSAQVDRTIMYRVLDVPGCLEALAPTGAGSFTVSVDDELIPENRGPWSVTDDGSAVKCSPSESGDLKASIQNWTQSYLGAPGFKFGLISGSEEGLSAADRLLPESPVYCQEFF